MNDSQHVVTMSVEQRTRFIAAARRALQWREDQIMAVRVTWVVLLTILGTWDDRRWHSLFECESHNHHPLRAKWVGPYDFTDTHATWLGRTSSAAPDGQDRP